MSIFRNLTGMFALVSMASPALADTRTAAFASASDQPILQSSTFVGATVRIGMNRKYDGPRYRASLGISRMAYSPHTSELRIGQGLELAFNGKTKPALSLAGMEAQDIRHVANMSGGGKAALIVAGTVAVLGVAALVAVNSLPCQDGDDPCD